MFDDWRLLVLTLLHGSFTTTHLTRLVGYRYHRIPHYLPRCLFVVVDLWRFDYVVTHFDLHSWIPHHGIRFTLTRTHIHTTHHYWCTACLRYCYTRCYVVVVLLFGAFVDTGAFPCTLRHHVRCGICYSYVTVTRSPFV